MAQSCRRIAWILLSVALFYLPLSAQVISGTVMDQQGAVMPNVQVEAASPALIERSRTTKTDSNGRYTIVDLAPGTYSVTFTMQGFQTFRQEGVVLATGVTAPINADLKIGGADKIIETVQAAASEVDVKDVAVARVLSREAMSALPTSRDVLDMALLIPGTSPADFHAGIVYRGQADSSAVTVDGMRTSYLSISGPAAVGGFSNEGIQEVSYANGVDSAEMAQPGLRIQVISKDGGNQFHGSAFISYTNDSFQTSNVDANLRSFGIKDPAKTLSFADVNPTFGGPIIKNKLWFQITGRYNPNDVAVLNSYDNIATTRWTFVPGPKLGDNSNWLDQGSARITWQVSSKDKIAGTFDNSHGGNPTLHSFFLPFFGVAEPNSATMVDTSNNRRIDGKWTRVQTPSLLFEIGLSSYNLNFDTDYPGAGAPWSARAMGPVVPLPPARYAIQDSSTFRLYDTGTFSDGNDSTTFTVTPSVSYIKSGHVMKFGVQYLNGTSWRPSRTIGDALFNVSGGNSKYVAPTLPLNEHDKINGDWGIYAQDKWTIKRLTLTGGLRFDGLFTRAEPGSIAPTVWLDPALYAAYNAAVANGTLQNLTAFKATPVGATFPGKNVLSWKDITPRIGAAYDLFGKGKTSLKFGIAKFVNAETTNFTSGASPVGQVASTDTAPGFFGFPGHGRTWKDVNGDGTIYNSDGTIQLNELGPSLNPNFGQVVAPNTTVDPKLLSGWGRRPFTWDLDATVQQQLWRNLTLSATYYRIWLGNQSYTYNRATPNSDFDAYSITVPADSRLPGGGGYTVSGLYQLDNNYAFLPQDNFETFATSVGNHKGQTDLTRGFELNLIGHFGKGFIQGGFAWRSHITDTCNTTADNPQKLYCHEETPFGVNGKLSGSYRLPWQIQVAGAYAMLRGPARQALYTDPNTFLQTNIVDPVKSYFPYTHQFDMRFSRIFSFGTDGKYKFTPEFDFYNIFNSNGVTGVNTNYAPPGTTGGTQWLAPQSVLLPRQFRIGAQFSF